MISPEDFLSVYRDLKDKKRRKEEAAAAFTAAKQHAKSLGVDLNALKIVEHLASLDDADAELRMRETLRYAAWMGLEIGTQPDMFEQPEVSLASQVAAQHNEWKAEQAGYDAGKSGDPSDNCPHPGTSPLNPRWHQGWRDGAALRTETKPPEGG